MPLEVSCASSAWKVKSRRLTREFSDAWIVTALISSSSSSLTFWAHPEPGCNFRFFEGGGRERRVGAILICCKKRQYFLVKCSLALLVSRLFDKHNHLQSYHEDPTSNVPSWQGQSVLSTEYNSLQRKCVGEMVYSVTCAVHQGSLSTILTGSSWQHPIAEVKLHAKEQMLCVLHAVCDLAWLRLNHTLEGFCILKSYQQDIVNYSTCSGSVYSCVTHRELLKWNEVYLQYHDIYSPRGVGHKLPWRAPDRCQVNVSFRWSTGGCGADFTSKYKKGLLRCKFFSWSHPSLSYPERL